MDFYKAIHTRKTVWATDKGTITVTAERFASMANQSIIALKYSVSADYDCNITIKSGIQGDIWDIHGPHFVKLNVLNDNGVKVVEGTTGEKAHVITAKEYIKADFECDRKINCDSMSAIEEISFSANIYN